MSNTLILVIVADYGAFYTSNKKNDLYEEYVLHSQRNYVTTSYVPKYEQVDKQCIAVDDKLLHGKKESIANGSPLKCVTISREISLLPIRRENTKGNKEKNSEIIPQREKANHARIRRSKSDRYHRDRVKSVLVDERKKRVRELETMKVEEENEFSKMTNEDLNKRVEEFIQKKEVKN
ncbi:unnamed protein product [Lupinus luteus]|uniref:Uncharacterized protein n=1 Tax=Lupinus luteus TaxID=3873 RepID=A0AAV1VW92_LUPLU